MSPSILIIGGGVIGLSCARQLSMNGFAVKLLDAGPRPGAEASSAGGGILSLLYSWRHSSDLRVLARRSQEIYPYLCEELSLRTGISPQFFKSGMLITGLDDREKKIAIEDPEIILVERNELKALQPGLVGNNGGVYSSEIANVRNPALVKALLLDCLQLGVEIYSNAKATRALKLADHYHVILEDGRKFESKYVLVSAGAWSSNLLKQFDNAEQVAPVKGQIIAIQARPGVLRRTILHKGRYLIPRRDGVVLVGSTIEHTGFDKKVDSETAKDLHKFAHALLPSLAQYPTIAHWAGLRPALTVDAPIIESLQNHPNVVVATGHYRSGIVCAPATAERVNKLFCGICCEKDRQGTFKKAEGRHARA